MCFAPQQRALSGHAQSIPKQKRFSFSLGYVLRATRPGTFLHLNSQKCSDIGVFSILESKRASLHWSARILISHPARLLRTRRFSKPTFPLSGVRSHETLLEKQCYATFVPFRALCFFFFCFSLFFDLFWLFLFSGSSHHCCRICPWVGSLTSKRPWIMSCQGFWWWVG